MTRILNALDDMIGEMMTPSAEDARAFRWAESGVGHAVVGLALTWALSFVLAWPLAAFATPPVYWIAKEALDLRAGGSLGNGLADTAFVALGPLAEPMDPFAWGAMVLAIAAGGALVREVLT